MDDRSLYYYRARLVRLIDADTCDLTISCGFRVRVEPMRLRLWGIDTPEMRTTTLGLGRAAREYALSLIQPASDAGLLRVSTRASDLMADKADSFGRYLAVLWVPDEAGAYYNLNEHLVTEGYAVPYFP